MLDSENWDGSLEILDLAHCVLTENFGDAANLMRKIGKHSRPSKTEYLQWPMFEIFRKREEFLLAFNDVFGEVTLTENEVLLPKPTAG